MSKFHSIALLAGVTSAARFALAEQAVPKVSPVPIQQTSAVSGQQMYRTYCASCRGAKGTGNGPAAAALKIPPTDLTLLSQKNGGVFPSSHVASVLQFGVENPAHGSPEIPIWGNLMLSLHKGNAHPEVDVNMRITNLTDYLKKIQR